ncbi:hypothetical protein WS89_03980 [Burkholderia sp. MSMB1072]|uniref:hypothetical protein n=1 Tax=Burkholderia sp. MSMB1072 TaxID=1637871 RepID=UPI000754762F|nr:hypothetical protein [Burkholderia sp. MSMB1072]KVH64450.1 hypothetical protein WS89_03980 [Burkholderia sp. MSMB1072]
MNETKAGKVVVDYHPAIEFRDGGLNEVILKVTDSGEFQWHKDADRMIEESDCGLISSMKHILKRLRAYEKVSQTG